MRPGKRVTIELSSNSLRALVDGQPVVVSNDGIAISVVFTGSVAATLRLIADAVDRGRIGIGGDPPMAREFLANPKAQR